MYGNVTRDRDVADIAIIGAGPTALYLLKNLVDQRQPLHVSIIDPSGSFGLGMPYSSAWVDDDHLANIACEEVPDLIDSPDDWLCGQSDGWLAARSIERREISPRYIPSRIVLGAYFQNQFEQLVTRGRFQGMMIDCIARQSAIDIDVLDTDYHLVHLTANKGESKKPKILAARKVVVATGHAWSSVEAAESKPFPMLTPWPIDNITDLSGKIGLLGSSLTAIDVAFTLAKRNGRFIRDFSGRLNYLAEDARSDFCIVMHSRRGLLPSQRFDFEFPRIRRHQYISESEIRQMIDEEGGRLDLDDVFDRSFKMPLSEKSPDLYAIIRDFKVEQFCRYIWSLYEGYSAFYILRQDALASQFSIYHRRPIYWKEILDDTAYMLTFYAKYLSEVDWHRLKLTLMPLVSHVVAFLPPTAAERLLALHEAGRLEGVALGADYTLEHDRTSNEIIIAVTVGGRGGRVLHRCNALVDCRGQRGMSASEFPFPSLVEKGVVTSVTPRPGGPSLRTKDRLGIEVNDLFQPVSESGAAHSSIAIVASPFISDLYPYHSGIPFCNEVGQILATEFSQPRRGAPLVGAGR